MKRILSTISICLITFQAYSQSATVTLRPHFTGIECAISWADSTHAAWVGSPVQYNSSTSFPNPVITSYMAWTSAGCPFVQRTLVKFADISNTSVIPAGSVITSATLYLYGIPSTPTGDYGNSTFPGSPYTMYGTNRGKISALSSAFTPATTTWNTRPSVASVTPVTIPPSNANFGTSDTLNVTALVSYLYANGNHGFEIRIDSESIYREHLYGSSRYSDSTKHPMLKITYTNHVGINSINHSVPRVTLYPNPANAQLQASIVADAATTITFNIYNTLGQKLYSSVQSLSVGDNSVNIPIDNLASGLYYAEFANGSVVTKQRFMKE